MSKPVLYQSAEEAEAAFYKAFEEADAETMMQVWAQDSEISCIHPGGQRLDTHTAIEQSWKEIFSQDARIRFKISDLRRSGSGDLAIHLVKEQIRIGGVGRGVALATNIYRRTDAGWRMVLHHASPEPSSHKRSQTQAIH